MRTYPGENLIAEYKEGLMVGYRYYDTFAVKPLFAFGHGLSYTEFKYKDMKIVNSLGKEGILSLSLTVENTGNYDGKETVQIYVSQKNPPVTRPFKELKAFGKKNIAKGSSEVFEFQLNKDDFAYYDELNNCWKAAYGEYEIIAAASSDDIRLTQKIVYEEKKNG